MLRLPMNNKQKRAWLLGTIVLSSLTIAFSNTESYAAGTTENQIAQKSQANEAITENTETKSDIANPKKQTKESEKNEESIPEAEDATYNNDPLEKFNRVVFVFNDTLDIYLIKPVAELYNAIIPKPLNQGIHNFFNNLGQIPIVVNDLLQFNFYQGAKDTSRFVINSTMGIGGLFDMATRMNLPYFQNDFGLTLATWGYRDSSYLVLPFLGSNTIRDGIGLSVDYFAFSVYPYVEPQSRRYQLLGLFYIDHRANLLQFEPILEEAAIDKYVFMRNAYMQHRTYQIEQIKHIGFKDGKKSEGMIEASSISSTDNNVHS